MTPKAFLLTVKVMDKRLIKVRFNTKHTGTYKWRVLIDGDERLAKSVRILVPCESSEDLLPSGEIKHHLTCVGKPEWNDGIVTIS